MNYLKTKINFVIVFETNKISATAAATQNAWRIETHTFTHAKKRFMLEINNRIFLKQMKINKKQLNVLTTEMITHRYSANCPGLLKTVM